MFKLVVTDSCIIEQETGNNISQSIVLIILYPHINYAIKLMYLILPNIDIVCLTNIDQPLTFLCTLCNN